MREDIKKRIEQIRRGEIPEGYKENRVGVFPTDWKYTKVKNLTSEHKQGFYTSLPYSKSGTYLIRITDLENPKVEFEEMPRMEITEKTYQQFKVANGDFLIARSGAIGRYGVIEEDVRAVFGSYIIRFRFNSSKLNNKYFGYFFQSQSVINQLGTITQGSSNQNINAENIKSLSIPLPNLAEQEQIAETLSTCDRVIELKKKLIEEKRKVKKWLMQTLLTGMIRVKDIENRTPYEELKKRIEQIRNGQIPEGYRRIGSNGIFPRDWTTVSLKTLSLFIRDGTHGTHKNYEDGVPLLSAKNVRDGRVFVDKTDRTISEEDYRHIHRHYELEPGDILMTIVGTVGRTATITHDLPRFTIQRSISIIRPREEHITEFLKNTLNTHYYQQQLYKLLNASAQGGVYLGALEKTKLVIPATNKEELQTAEILSTADKEIDLLNKDLEQWELKKKSLLQLLLTGIVRTKA